MMTDYHEYFHQVMQISRAFINEMNKELRKYNLYYSQFIVMCYLNDQGASLLVDIAGYFNLEKSSVTRTVCRLEKTGLIRQIPVKDRREKRIILSDSGKTVLAQCHEMANRLTANAMEHITGQEYELSSQTLLKVADNLNKLRDTANE